MAKKAKSLLLEEDMVLAGLDLAPTYNVIKGTPDSDLLIGTSGADRILGRGGADLIFGAGGNDLLSGGKGIDLLDGGAGRDTADYSKADGGVAVSLALGLALDDGDGAVDILASIENVTGSAHDDVIAGNNQANDLAGGGGNDLLSGGKGPDVYLHSGTSADGDDTIKAGDNGVDRVIFTTPDLYDLRYERHGNDLVIGTYLAGSSFPDGPFDGSLRIVNHYAGAAIDTVEIDTDFYNTTYGTDPEVARFHFTTDLANGLNNTDDTEVLLGSESGETINGNGGYYDMIFGNGGDDIIHAGDANFSNIRGGTGNDQIFGEGGADSIRGGEGDDLIDGGEGSDFIQYDAATGGIDLDFAAGYAKDIDASGNSGTDTLANVERARGTGFDDLLAGNAGSNDFLAGNGDDTVHGRAGFDVLEGEVGNDKLFGGDDDDLLIGGDGDDFLFGGQGVDFLIGGEGVDTFQLSVLNHPIEIEEGVFLNDSPNVGDLNRDEDILLFSDLVDIGGDGLDLGDLNAQIDSFSFDADFGVVGVFFVSGSAAFFNNQTAAISSIEELVSNAATQIQLA